MSAMIVPQKLKPGDMVRVIAPSKSLKIVSAPNIAQAIMTLKALGLSVTFSQHAGEFDCFGSSEIKSRVDDLHAAFLDPQVRGILTVLGGYNVNQLIAHLDYDLIQQNPKILCGFSDITALQNAITAKTGLVTYSGPHFSSFGMQKGCEYTLAGFRKMFFEDSQSLALAPAETWSDDAWYLDQENRQFYPNEGFFAIQTGKAEGAILGGNLGTLNLLNGTEYQPVLKNKILFIEEVVGHVSNVDEFDRQLQALSHQPGTDQVRGIVIGRFEKAFGMTPGLLQKIIASKVIFQHIPIASHADFGHTTPIFTFPIGGHCAMDVAETTVALTIQT